MGVNKVVFGAVSIMDISDSTVTAEALAEGVTAYDKTGEKITGKLISKKVAMGSVSKTSGAGTISVSGLGFKPTKLLLSSPHDRTQSSYKWFLALVIDTDNNIEDVYYTGSDDGTTSKSSGQNSYFTWQLTNDGFSVTATNPGRWYGGSTYAQQKHWIAIG